MIFQCLLQLLEPIYSSGFTASVDSTTSTSSTVIMTSCRTLIVTTSPIDIRQEQNDDGGSDVGRIVTGCVVAFILIIAIVVHLVIFLIWYRTSKKRDHTTASGLELKLIAAGDFKAS